MRFDVLRFRLAATIAASEERLSRTEVGVIKFLLRRTYAKRGLVSGAIQRLEPPRDNIRLAELSWRPRGHQIEADDEAILRSVKKALDTIAAANAEMASPSRQLQTSA